MMKFTVNAESVVKNIEKSLDLARNTRPLLMLILGKADSKNDWTIRGATLKNFATRSDPDGKRWPNLNPKYAEKKIKEWGMKPILVASGRLFESLVGNGTDETVLILTANKLTYGTSVPYFKYHQQSGGAMPQRQALGWSKKQTKIINTLISEYFKDVLLGKKEAANGSPA